MTKRAAVYLRQSMDREEGIEGQRKRTHALTVARGWEVVAEFVDNDVKATKSRDTAAWGEMVARAQAGEFDVIVATKVDRLARRVRDILDLADSGLGIATVEADLDTTTEMGRFQAILLTALAELETNRKGQRHRDAHADRAARGIPRTTKRPYGWQKDGMTLEPEEAEHLRTAVRNIVAGKSIRGEAERMNAAGARTPQYAKSGGEEWTAKSLVSVLDRPRMAGINVYLGVETEHSRIQPVVTREEWEEYRAIRQDPSRLSRTPGRTPLAHWMSGVAYCPCGETLRASTASNRGRRYDYYRCVNGAKAGHVGIAAKTLEGVTEFGLYVTLLGRKEAVTDGRVRELRIKRQALADQIERATESESLATTPVGRKAARRALEGLEREWTQVDADLTEALSRAAGASVVARMGDALTAEKRMHPSFSATLDVDDVIAAVNDERSGWARAFRALTVEERRNLTNELVRVDVAPFEPGIDPADRVTVTPK